MGKVVVSNDKIGFFGLLGIVFIVLKLTNIIDWSWWWVTAPLWGGIAIALTCFIFYILFIAIFGLIAYIKGK